MAIVFFGGDVFQTAAEESLSVLQLNVRIRTIQHVL